MLENETSGESEGTESSFNLREAADELISNEAQADSTQAKPADGSAETPPVNTVSDEQRALDILNGKEVGTEAKPDAAYLEHVNALGFVHNGQAFKVETPERLKEIIQQGFDYTKKTMAHAEEVKSFQAQSQEREQQYSAREQELHGTSFKNNMVDSMVERLKTEDLDLYNHLQEQFQREISEYQKNQPVIAHYENKFKQLEDRFAQLDQGKHQSNLGEIKGNWEKQLNELQTTKAARFKELGIIPNYDKVKEVWSADNTNKMTVEQAFAAVHGTEMINASESQMKKLKAAAEVTARKLGRGGVSNSQKAGAKIAAPAGDYRSILRQSLDQM